MGLGVEEEWYISAYGIKVNDEPETYYDADSESITLADDRTLSLDDSSEEQKVLKCTLPDSTVPTFLYRISGADSTFTLAVTDSTAEEPLASKSRGLSTLAGLQVIITNLNNPENSDEYTTLSDGSVSVDDVILGDDYLVEVPAQGGMDADIDVQLTPLFDGQDLGLLDLAGTGSNLKVNVRTEVRTDLLIADGTTDYTVFVDIINLGWSPITDLAYLISSADLGIGGDFDAEIESIPAGTTYTVEITALCPEITAEEALKSLQIQVVDFEGNYNRTEDLSLKFYKKHPNVQIYLNREIYSVAPLVIKPDGLPVRIKGSVNVFNWQPGNWLVVFGGGGSGNETKYSIGIDAFPSTDWDLLIDPAHGEDNDTEAEATILVAGGSDMQYLGAKGRRFLHLHHGRGEHPGV